MSESTAKPEPSPFERFQRLAAQVVSVPKTQADEEEKRFREERAKSRKQRETPR